MFIHTFVPKSLRGRGIAASLVRAALAYAEANSYKVVPTCSYVASYMNRHEEFSHLRRDPGTERK